jgi:hypothetical protein
MYDQESHEKRLFPGLSLRFGRVVVIEWLFPNEHRTGRELVDWMQSEGFQDRRGIELHVVNSRIELLDTISDLATSTSRGEPYPLIHIEAHGEDLPLPTGYIGPDGQGDRDLVAWEDLTPRLVDVNVATQCNLLLVSAACWGHAAILAACRTDRVPFAACVGFTSSVYDFDLLESMKEFSCRLLDNPAQLIDVVTSAEQKLPDAGLEMESIPVLSYETLTQNMREYLEPNAFHERALNLAMRLIDDGLPNIGQFPYSSARVQLHTQQAAIAQITWNRRFMIDLFPGNEARFGVDVKAIVNRMLDEEFGKAAAML